jgi:hypothetical protein
MRLRGSRQPTAVTLSDRCQGSDFASLSGNSGYGAIFGAQRSVAIDQTEALAEEICSDAQRGIPVTVW